MPQNLLMISGLYATGKSASLKNLRDPEGVLYISTESNKPLPFPHKFKTIDGGLQDPEDILFYFAEAEKMPGIHTIVIDSIDFLMDMFESQKVLTARDSRAMWGEYNQFFKKIMQDHVATSSKNWIFISHLAQEQISDLEYKFYVPVKGALKNTSVEAYFSVIVYARKVKVKDLEAEPYDDKLLTITDRDRKLGFKYVFQVDITKEFTNSGIRGLMGMWSDQQTFMDNDVQKLLDHMTEFYKNNGE